MVLVCSLFKLFCLFLFLFFQINAHYYLHPYFNIYMHQIIKGLWLRRYPRKDSCGIGTHKVEIQPTIDLVEYGGLWLACGLLLLLIFYGIHKYMNEDKSNKYTKQLSNQFIFLLGSLGIGTAKD